jgi:hypothetical protein
MTLEQSEMRFSPQNTEVAVSPFWAASAGSRLTRTAGRVNTNCTSRKFWDSSIGTSSGRSPNGESSMYSLIQFAQTDGYPMPASPTASFQYSIVSSLIAGSGLFCSSS